MDANTIVDLLHMKPIPEGGRCAVVTRHENGAYSSICYLLRQGEVSCFHRLRHDELWVHHSGAPFSLYMVETGCLVEYKLGSNLLNGERPQILVRAGTIFGAIVRGAWGLCGCVVIPAFESAGLELIAMEQLEGIKGDAALIHQLAYRGGNQ